MSTDLINARRYRIQRIAKSRVIAATPYMYMYMHECVYKVDETRANSRYASS